MSVKFNSLSLLQRIVIGAGSLIGLMVIVFVLLGGCNKTVVSGALVDRRILHAPEIVHFGRTAPSGLIVYAVHIIEGTIDRQGVDRQSFANNVAELFSRHGVFSTGFGRIERVDDKIDVNPVSVHFRFGFVWKVWPSRQNLEGTPQISSFFGEGSIYREEIDNLKWYDATQDFGIEARRPLSDLVHKSITRWTREYGRRATDSDFTSYKRFLPPSEQHKPILWPIEKSSGKLPNSFERAASGFLGSVPGDDFFTWLSNAEGKVHGYDIVPVSETEYWMTICRGGKLIVWKCKWDSPEAIAKTKEKTGKCVVELVGMFSTSLSCQYYAYWKHNSLYIVTFDGHLYETTESMIWGQYLTCVRPGGWDPIVAVLEVPETGRVYAFSAKECIELSPHLRRFPITLTVPSGAEPERSLELLRLCAKEIASQK